MQRDNSKISVTSVESDGTTKSARKKITFDKELIQSMKRDDSQVEEFEKWMLGRGLNICKYDRSNYELYMNELRVNQVFPLQICSFRKLNFVPSNFMMITCYHCQTDNPLYLYFISYPPLRMCYHHMTFILH